MRRLVVDVTNPAAAVLAEACACLRAGGLVAFPTDTLYGLTVDCTREDARRQLSARKGRAETAPVPFLIADMEMITGIAREPLPRAAETVARSVWPAPVTIVVPACPEWSWTAPDGTVGVRLPDAPLARALCEAMTTPLPATSANATGSTRPALTADDVSRELTLGDGDCLLDGGPLPPSRGSTVIRCEHESWLVIREGDYPVDALTGILGAPRG